MTSTASVKIKVWICPTPFCGNYYGATSMPDLSQGTTGDRGMNGEKIGEPRPRKSCPDCFERDGTVVDRVLVGPIPVHFDVN